MSTHLGTLGSDNIGPDATGLIVIGYDGNGDPIYDLEPNNLIFGLGGTDFLFGGIGEDQVIFGIDASSSGTSVGSGGDGEDTLVIQAAGAPYALVKGFNNSGFLWFTGDFYWHETENPDGSTTLKEGIYFNTFEHYEIYSGIFDDSIVGGVLNDILDSGGGDDVIDSRGGADIVDGGGGIDLWRQDFSAVATGISFAVDATSTIGVAGSLVSGIERVDLTSGSGNDQLTGGALDDRLDGRAGDDTLAGGTGTDVIIGGDGDDRLVVTLSANASDSVYGGNGIDTIVIDGSAVTGSVRSGNNPPSGFYDNYWNGVFSLDSRLYYFDIERFEITGGGFADILTGSVGNDVLIGNGGDDMLRGGAGIDTINGGEGRDLWTGDLSAVTANIAFELSPLPMTVVNGTILTSIEAVGLTAGSGNDTLTGGAFDDSLHGGAGNDVLYALAGEDSLSGNAGDDWVVVRFGSSLAGATIDGGDGIDVLVIDAEHATGVLSQSTTYAEGLTTVHAFSSNFERLEVIGSAGNDFFTGFANADLLEGRAGNDTIRGNGGDDEIFGGADNDRIDGDEGNDTVNGGDGDDTLNGQAGDDSIAGWLGADFIDAGDGNNSVNAGDGNDRVFAGTGDDTIAGGDGDDQVFAGAGDDSVDGGNGNDVLDTATGAGIVDGGLGTDRWIGDLTARVDDVNFTLGTIISSPFFGGPTLISIEEVSLGSGSGNDALAGAGGNDVLRGGEGQDSLVGGGGRDELYGEAGDDLLSLTPGGSAFSEALAIGGAGTDRLVIDHSSSTTAMESRQDLAYSDRGEYYDGSASRPTLLFYEIEHLDVTGTAHDDTITGSAGADILRGGDGADRLIGGGGDDTIYAGSHGDTVVYSGAVADYSFSLDMFGNYHVVDTRAPGPGIQNDGHDQLRDIELLTFSNGTFTLPDLFGIYLNRPPTDINLVATLLPETSDTLQPLTRIVTTDPDANETFIYRLTSDPSGKFRIVGDELFLRPGERLDYEAATDHTIDIEVTDRYGAIFTKSITVNVLDINEAPTNISLAAVSILEGTANGTVVGTVSAIDPESSPVTFSLSDGSSGRFTLVGNEIRVADGLSLDYEQRPFYTIYVRATDTSGMWFEQGLRVDIANVDPESFTGDSRANAFVGGLLGDSLSGEGGNDTLLGGAGNDSLVGGAGDDFVYGEAGIDTLRGGAGSDIYILDSAEDVVIEDAGSEIDGVVALVSALTLPTNVESMTLFDGVVGGIGNDAANSLVGNTIGNSLDGVGGNDTLAGDAGNDTLNGGAGADTMIGGLGNDTFYIDHAGDIVTEALNQGSDIVRATVSKSLAANLETLILDSTAHLNGAGNELANTLIGNSGNNVLDGRVGADRMFGHAGNDTYVVDNVGDVVGEVAGNGIDTVRSSTTYTLGNEVEKLLLLGSANINGTGNGLANAIVGNTGSNRLDGAAGNDSLTGGLGLDYLTGGLGNDNFIYGAVA
ncbi:MAG: cadherin domain-containing protein, partial [Hyphomicrobiaceae bacterium]|nr:cadherin domain-containing protein [Hyphomicrobiaceae bacterium]